ncbi:MAG: hypothetical protein Q4B68_05015 [Bacteroidales bacterium]|nr:hypothetical protein [Bacteroidales bacterium]
MEETQVYAPSPPLPARERQHSPEEESNAIDGRDSKNFITKEPSLCYKNNNIIEIFV